MIRRTTIVFAVLLALQPLSGFADCTGDCSGDNRVGVSELVEAVGIALGKQSLTACESVDANKDTAVTVEEIVGAVRRAVEGCGRDASTPTPTPTPTVTQSATPQSIPTSARALTAWLRAGNYLDWAAESSIHPPRGPHGSEVRVYFNPVLI